MQKISGPPRYFRRTLQESLERVHSEKADGYSSVSLVTVAGLTDYVGALLETDERLRQIWVAGEVSSASERSSGTYFTLSEPDGSASLRCVVWCDRREELVQQPISGDRLVVLGSLGLYEKRGEYQLSVLQALPAGEGLRALRYRQLRARLAAEGLFDASRKQPLPACPQVIAVVTSPHAAAWGDIQRTLFERHPALRVLLSPAVVQGELAPPSIARALDRVERDGRAELAILGRGGGAAEDLICFNDERVVQAIARCPIPVVTGIGHQRDESLADLAADWSAHTPTAAAERAVPDFPVLLREHRQRQQALVAAFDFVLARQADRLQRTKARLRSLPEASRRLLAAERQQCLLQEKLAALDPQAVLQRGYALLQAARSGEIVKTADALAPGMEVIARLGRGRARLNVVETLPDP